MDDRLARLESKIDKLQEAVVSLARVEEQLVSVYSRQTSIENQINTLENKTEKLGEQVIQSRIIERLVWLGLAGAIGMAFRFIA